MGGLKKLKPTCRTNYFYTLNIQRSYTSGGIIKMHFHVGNGPIKILKGLILFKKRVIRMKNHKIVNKDRKDVKSEKK